MDCLQRNASVPRPGSLRWPEQPRSGRGQKEPFMVKIILVIVFVLVALWLARMVLARRR